MNLRRYILIFHQAALGDFVMTWPLAMALGRVFAQSRVMYVTGSEKGALAENVIGVEHVSADAGWHLLHSAAEIKDDRILRMLAGTQCAVLFAEKDEETFVSNVRKYAGAEVPLIHIRPNPPAGVHVAAHQLAQLAGHGKIDGYVEQMQSLIRSSGLASAAPPADASAVVIHPGSGSPAKTWPIEQFVEAARTLREIGRPVSVVLGEVERERWPAEARAKLAAVAEVIEPKDLVGLKNTLARFGTYLGNDSGPTHLAAMLGLKTVAMFGPASSPEQWQPIGPRVTVLPFESSIQSVVDHL